MHLFRLLVALLIWGGSLSAQEERIPVENWPPQQNPEEMAAGFDPLRLVTERPVSTSPLRISNNSTLHSLFGILPLESATPLEEGRVELGLFEDVSSASLEIINSEFLFRYDAVLLESNLEVRAGMEDGWEFHAGLDISNLLEQDDDIVLIHNGTVLINAGQRGLALGDLRLGMKKSLFEFGEKGNAGFVIGSKIPLSRSNNDLLTSGGVDFAASLLASQDMGGLTLHVNLGAIVPGDVEVFEEDVDTTNALTFGVGAVIPFETWGVLALQLQAHQSLFHDSDDSLGILDENVATAHAGIRARIGSYFLELSLGSGLTDTSSDSVITLSFLFPL